MAMKSSSFSDDRSLLTSEDDNNGQSSYGATNTEGPSFDPSPSPHHHPGPEKADGPKRSVTKKGLRNIKPQNVNYTERAFWIDIFTTFLDAQWRWLLFVIFVGYFSSWLLFGAIWFTILYIHGDFDPRNLSKPDWRPCVTNMEDFTSTFLFSLETQQTTGYGFYHITEQCPSAIIILSIQSIVGVILEGVVMGLVLLKMSRAKKRSATLIFSRHAVVSRRDGHLCLMFRVADLRDKSTLLQATIRAQLITSRVTLEGDEVPISQTELDVGGEGERGNNLLLLWPTTVIHRIDDTSPLSRFIDVDNWDVMAPAFEIIVILEGVVESTGLLTQARTSYLSSEILWGHSFKSLKEGKGKSVEPGSTYIDYANFHDTYEVSAKAGGHVTKKWSY